MVDEPPTHGRCVTYAYYLHRLPTPLPHLPALPVRQFCFSNTTGRDGLLVGLRTYSLPPHHTPPRISTCPRLLTHRDRSHNLPAGSCTRRPFPYPPLCWFKDTVAGCGTYVLFVPVELPFELTRLFTGIQYSPDRIEQTILRPAIQDSTGLCFRWCAGRHSTTRSTDVARLRGQTNQGSDPTPPQYPTAGSVFRALVTRMGWTATPNVEDYPVFPPPPPTGRPDAIQILLDGIPATGTVHLVRGRIGTLHSGLRRHLMVERDETRSLTVANRYAFPTTPDWGGR